MHNTRRSFLKSAAGASALSLLPPNIRAALAGTRAGGTGTIKDIEHVVIFMQENRSFDHYFGTLAGVRGFGDPRAIMLPNAVPVWYQPDGKDTVAPFHLDTAKTSAQFMQSLDHSWKGSHDLWKNHDSWIATKTALTMGYFTRADLPFYYALADSFTICDAYHCSVFGPTNPNRLYLFSGTSGLTAGNEDVTAVANPHDEENETADMANDSKGFKPFEWTTYAERLEKAGVSWRVYQEFDNYGDNALAYFKAFRAGAPPSAMHEKARAWAEGSNAANAKSSRGEHLVAQFAADVAQGRLPQVSWIVAPTIMSEHPSAPPGYGENLTWRLLDALAANPDVWNRTAFFLTYDENDGFFDHVPPPVPPITPELGASTVDTTGESYHGTPFGLGPRVPMIVVSPWSAGGLVNSEVFDHTSLIRLVETRFGVAEPNISRWRRAVTGDLTSTFDFRGGGAVALPSSGRDGIARADRSQALVKAALVHNPALPKQEPGGRPRCALPYRLEASGASVPGGFRFDFENKGKAGAVFRVSSGDANAGPWFFTVEAGKSLSHTVPREGKYDFSLLGPDGFYRHFSGGDGDAVKVSFVDGVLTVHENQSSLALVGSAYERKSLGALKKGETGTFAADLARSGNWYDMTINCLDGFLRRYAGHLEGNTPSRSDPLLG